MLTEFGKVFLFFLLGIIFVAAGLLVAMLLRPHNPTHEKNMPYECGEEPIGPQWMKFNIRFYVIALIFLLILEAGHIYAWRSGALDWASWRSRPQKEPRT